jgi:hypothetical protein
VLLAAAAVFVFAATERENGPVFIEGGKPVTVDQLADWRTGQASPASF